MSVDAPTPEDVTTVFEAYGRDPLRSSMALGEIRKMFQADCTAVTTHPGFDCFLKQLGEAATHKDGNLTYPCLVALSLFASDPGVAAKIASDQALLAFSADLALTSGVPIFQAARIRFLTSLIQGGQGDAVKKAGWVQPVRRARHSPVTSVLGAPCGPTVA